MWFKVLPSVLDPLDTNRFRWKNSFSIREGLRKISLMMDQGVKRRSDGKAHFSIRERLRKIPLMLDEWVESRSDGVHRIHWKRIDSDGKVHFSIRERLRKFHSCCIRG